jgi:hypothetical protein
MDFGEVKKSGQCLTFISPFSPSRSPLRSLSPSHRHRTASISRHPNAGHNPQPTRPDPLPVPCASQILSIIPSNTIKRRVADGWKSRPPFSNISCIKSANNQQPADPSPKRKTKASLSLSVSPLERYNSPLWYHHVVQWHWTQFCSRYCHFRPCREQSIVCQSK